jgi:hypothetical protein
VGESNFNKNFWFKLEPILKRNGLLFILVSP